MSSSWFNLSGNLSSIASNVTSFTKEVLKDAASDSFEDIHTGTEFNQEHVMNTNDYERPDDLLKKISTLQNEMQHLLSNSALKDEQISQLQAQNEEISCEYETHFEKLRENLLEKEKEIQSFSQRFNEVGERNTYLENNLSKKHLNTDWENDWGDDNSEKDVNDLLFQNECLANDLAMKEIIIGTVESKMFEISKENIEISNFAEWICGVLQEREITSHNNVESELQSKVIQVEKENNELHNIIRNIELSVSTFSDSTFQIANFSQWLDEFSHNVRESGDNDSSKHMLEKIEKEIRDFDDDDGDFEVANFSQWLEKVECRIDDLEVEVINEQESRDSEEKQRIVERETLNDLFTQKQNEISMLKVELYNKSRNDHSHTSLNPIAEIEQEDLMTVHEQLNETTARCEALQLELATTQKQVMEANGVKSKFNEISAQHQYIEEELLRCQSAKEDAEAKYSSLLAENEGEFGALQVQLSELTAEISSVKQKYATMELSKENAENELSEMRRSYDSICEEFSECKRKYENMCAQYDELSNQCCDVNKQLTTLLSAKKLTEIELEESKAKCNSISDQFHQLSADNEEITRKLEDAETASNQQQILVDKLSAINDCVKEQLVTSESSKDSVERELCGLKIQYDSLLGKLEKHSSDFEEITNRYELLQDVVEEKENSLKSLQVKFDELSANADNIEQQLVLSHSTNETIATNIGEYQVKYNSMNEEVGEMCRQLDKITAKCKCINSNENVGDEQTSNSHKLKQIDTALSLLIAREEELEGQLDNMITECNSLHSQVEEEKVKAQIEVAAAQEIKNKLSSVNNELTAQACAIDADINLMIGLLSDLTTGGLHSCDFAISINNDNLKKIIGLIKVIAEKYISVESQIGDVDNEKAVEACPGTDDYQELYSILIDIVNCIDAILPSEMKQDIVVSGKLSSTDASCYNVLMKSLQKFISSIEEANGDFLKLNTQLQQELENMEEAVEIEKTSNKELTTTIGDLTAVVADHVGTIKQLQSTTSGEKSSGGIGGMKFGAIKRKLQELETANQSLKQENAELRKGGEPCTGDESKALRSIQSALNDKVHECECYQEECKLLKSSLLEMQEQITIVNSAHRDCHLLEEKLQEYEEKLVTVSGKTDEASAESRHRQEQLHNVSLILTEKNEEVQQYQEEIEQLKSKIVEAENETSDFELLREECKQLKNMLVGKEHENKVDDTIAILQTQAKQLKQIINTRDAEIQHVQNALIEKENDLSNMELIQEECKQLKQMLVTKGTAPHFSPGHGTQSSHDSLAAQLEAKDGEIIELQNSICDMELLKEECKQLKEMLIKNSSLSVSDNPAKDTGPNISCQLLEAMLEDRDVELAQKNAYIAELQNKRTNTNHDISFPLSPLPTSCANCSTDGENSFLLQLQQLEEFLKEKERMLANKDKEIGGLQAKLTEKEDIISQFDSIQKECEEMRNIIVVKEKGFVELENDLDNANSIIHQKNQEIREKESLYSELERSIEESKNIIVSKEVEIERLNEEITENISQDENLHMLQTEFHNVEERLNATQDELHEVQEKLNESRKACEQLKKQSEQNSLLENDTAQLLNQQVNQLKTLLYGSDQKNEEYRKLLEEKEMLLEDTNMQSKLQMDKLQREEKIEMESLQSEKSELLELADEKDANLHMMESHVATLEKQLEININEINAMNKKNLLSEKTINKQKMITNEKVEYIKTLSLQLSQKEIEKRKLEEMIDETQENMKEKENELITEKNKISELQRKLMIFKERIEEETNEVQTNNENLNNEMKVITPILESIEKMLDLSEEVRDVQEGSFSIAEHLAIIESALHRLITNIKQLTIENSKLNAEKSEAKLMHGGEVKQMKLYHEGVISNLENNIEESKSEISQQKSTYEDKLQHLQNQIVEYSEIKSLYNAKCKEYNDLEEHSLKQEKENEEQIKYLEHSSNTKECKKCEFLHGECELLREELSRTAHTYLEKNTECDNLKLENLQLEDNIYQLKLTTEKMKHLEETARLAENLEITINNKDEKINELQSIIEDNILKLESSKKEKAFLEELTKTKEQLDKEKEELLYQNEHCNQVVQEKDILLKHKDVTLREMEAKAKRELERLRNHMMLSEEGHTKDIVELQEREDALQKELDEAKQGLSKKSIILQDSSKQFQEHCIDLEEQLHFLSSQRDSTLLQLSTYQEKSLQDGAAIYNLQNALEQLQKEKTEQSEYLATFAKRKEIEYESRIDQLTQELNKTQGAMSEAALAVQGINKLNLELQQKENELRVSKEKINDLVGHLQQLKVEHDKILEAADHKLDKSLLRNLFMKYFKSPNDKRADILHVIGGLLGWSAEEIHEIGSGTAPSKVGGWITNVWAYGSPKKTMAKSTTPTYDSNKSFSELFVNFLESESSNANLPVDTTSLMLNTEVTPNIQMLAPSTPDILAFHNNSSEQRIPAPGQEIARVHTHHAQSTLKNILTTNPY